MLRRINMCKHTGLFPEKCIYIIFYQYTIKIKRDGIIDFSLSKSLHDLLDSYRYMDRIMIS